MTAITVPQVKLCKNGWTSFTTSGHLSHVRPEVKTTGALSVTLCYTEYRGLGKTDNVRTMSSMSKNDYQLSSNEGAGG